MRHLSFSYNSGESSSSGDDCEPAYSALSGKSAASRLTLLSGRVRGSRRANSPLPQSHVIVGSNGQKPSTRRKQKTDDVLDQPRNTRAVVGLTEERALHVNDNVLDVTMAPNVEQSDAARKRTGNPAGGGGNKRQRTSATSNTRDVNTSQLPALQQQTRGNAAQLAQVPQQLRLQQQLLQQRQNAGLPSPSQSPEQLRNARNARNASSGQQSSNSQLQPSQGQPRPQSQSVVVQVQQANRPAAGHQQQRDDDEDSETSATGAQRTNPHDAAKEFAGFDFYLPTSAVPAAKHPRWTEDAAYYLVSEVNDRMRLHFFATLALTAEDRHTIVDAVLGPPPTMLTIDTSPNSPHPARLPLYEMAYTHLNRSIYERGGSNCKNWRAELARGIELHLVRVLVSRPDVADMSASQLNVFARELFKTAPLAEIFIPFNKVIDFDVVRLGGPSEMLQTLQTYTLTLYCSMIRWIRTETLPFLDLSSTKRVEVIEKLNDQFLAGRAKVAKQCRALGKITDWRYIQDNLDKLPRPVARPRKSSKKKAASKQTIYELDDDFAICVPSDQEDSGDALGTNIRLSESRGDDHERNNNDGGFQGSATLSYQDNDELEMLQLLKRQQALQRAEPDDTASDEPDLADAASPDYDHDDTFEP